MGLRRQSRFALLSVVTIVVSTSVAVLPRAEARPLDPINPAEQAARLAALQHSPWNGYALEKPVSGGACIKSTVDLQIIEPNTGLMRPLTIQQSRPANKLGVPFVVIVPTIEGVTSLETNVAKQLCDYGMATAIAEVNDPTFPTDLPSWGYEDRNNRWAILALRTVLDYGQSNNTFDGNRLGMIGLSLGGITTAMMAGIEPTRLKAIVIAVGSGNMPFVLSNSEQAKVADFRQRRMKHEGIKTVTEYEDALRATMLFDPIYFASNAVRDNIMMVMAKADVKVPTLVQQELFEAFQKPTSEVYSGGHVDTLVKMTFWYFQNVASFFQSRFGMRLEMLQASSELPAAGGARTLTSAR